MGTTLLRRHRRRRGRRRRVRSDRRLDYGRSWLQVGIQFRFITQPFLGCLVQWAIFPG